MNYLLWEAVKPSSLICEFFLAGILLLRVRPVLGRRLLSVAAALFAAFAVAPGAWLLMRPLESWAPPPAAPRAGHILVLSGGEKIRLSESLGQLQLKNAGDRLLHAAALAHKLADGRLLHSGGGQLPAPAGLAAAMSQALGVDADRILIEDRSADTCDNLYRSKALAARHGLLEDRWTLVTSAAHMPRAMACAAAADFPVRPYAVDFEVMPEPPRRPVGLFWLTGLETADLAAHEYVGLIYYYLRGRTETLWPAAPQSPSKSGQ